MKTLYESIFDIDSNIENAGTMIVAEKEFNEMFYCSLADPGKMTYTISKKPNRDGKYEIRVKVKKGAELCVNSKYLIKNSATTIESHNFVLKRVDGTFSISDCPIINLKGSPEIVNGLYRVSYCDRLQSYEGIPKKVTDFASFQKNNKIFSEYDLKKVCDAGMFLGC